VILYYGIYACAHFFLLPSDAQLHCNDHLKHRHNAHHHYNSQSHDAIESDGMLSPVMNIGSIYLQQELKINEGRKVHFFCIILHFNHYIHPFSEDTLYGGHIGDHGCLR
jgi:hypothetical protein